MGNTYRIGKERMLQVIKEATKHKRESKTVTTLLLALDYMIYFRNNGVAGEYPGKLMLWNITGEESEKSLVFSTELCTIVDDVLFHFTKTLDGARVVDGIQAISLYLLLTFDWDLIKESVKDCAKDLLYYATRESIEEKKAVGEHEKIGGRKYGRDLLAYILRTSHKIPNGSPRTRILVTLMQ